MKNLLLLFLFALSLGVNAQVQKHTTEGEAVDFQNKIVLNTQVKSAIQTVTDSVAINVEKDIVQIITTDSINIGMANGKLIGKVLTLTMTVDGGDFVITPINLLIGTKIILNDAGDYWTGYWSGTKWVTLQKTANIQ